MYIICTSDIRGVGGNDREAPVEVSLNGGVGHVGTVHPVQGSRRGFKGQLVDLAAGDVDAADVGEV